MTPVDGATDTINLLLLRGREHWLAVAAEEGSLLSELATTDGDEDPSPRLLRAAGIDEDDYPAETIVLVLPGADGARCRWALPRPDELLPCPAKSLQPVSPLIAAHLRIRGVIGFVTHLERPVVILDPRLLVPGSEEDEGKEGTEGGLSP